MQGVHTRIRHLPLKAICRALPRKGRQCLVLPYERMAQSTLEDPMKKARELFQAAMLG